MGLMYFALVSCVRCSAFGQFLGGRAVRFEGNGEPEAMLDYERVSDR